MEINCNKCGPKDSSEFSVRKGTPTGYQYSCKACQAKMNAENNRRKKEKAKKGPRTNATTKAQHRSMTLAIAGMDIADGVCVADTPRSLTYILSILVERQLLLYYESQVKSVFAKQRVREVVDDAIFEFKTVLARTAKRMRNAINSDTPDDEIGDLISKPRSKRLDALRILGLTESASEDDIKAAYKKKAATAHPDAGGSTEKMQQLNEALSVLMED